MTRRAGRSGFTLIEMMIALVMGLIVLSATMSIALTSWRSLRGMTLRDGIDRRARFIGVSLQRDVQEAGVDLESGIAFGALVVWSDTAVFLRVPYAPNAATAYALSLTPAYPDGQCGATCLEIVRPANAAVDLAPGDLARVQAGQSVRRLVVISTVEPLTATTVRIGFTAPNPLIHQPSGIGGLATGSGTLVQRLGLVAYYRDGTQLMRAEAVDAGGSFRGTPVATGVQSWSVALVFTDGDTLTTANGTDSDATNNYNQIAGVRFQGTLTADRVDPRINNGGLLTRSREWYLVPRNLVYERNRI
ncbi:MAG TPA: prepilin-type N-terminal cleavage/methylation domain-containing protein [Gemmatimonadales bacterium]|jgi:prepilin-type N-terminal cleavage/methylation domain-containing protein